MLPILIDSRTSKKVIGNHQAIKKAQLRGSIVNTLKILNEMEKARKINGENSIIYKKAEEKLDNTKTRSNFVVWYYNYLKMIGGDPCLSNEEKKIWTNLIFKEMTRIYKEKHRYKNWLQKDKKEKIDQEFLKWHLMTDRFLNLVLRVYEKNEQDIKATEKFFEKALLDPNPMDYILRDLRENIKVTHLRKYRIKRGDTLMKVFGKKWKKIAKYNEIKDPSKLQIRQIIIIPEQTINIPKHIDKITQFCLLAAYQLIGDTQERITIAEVTLAIARVESWEGRRIGTGTYHSDMKPGLEKLIFLKICQALGLDPETTPVSKKPSYGWGGAMGPGQFLPSTWLNCEADVCLMTNQKFVSPYNLKHAIFATASKLVASGVASGGSDAQKRAAMRYFAGKNWDKAEYQFYWDRKVEPELKKIRKNKEIEKLIKKPTSNKNN